jgi:hypothetical protein
MYSGVIGGLDADATLLWADGDPIRHRTAQNLRHGIVVVCGLQFQPGALGVLLQQALSFQAAADTLADKLNQILQFAFIRCLDALKPSGLVIAIDVNTSATRMRSTYWSAPFLDHEVASPCRLTPYCCGVARHSGRRSTMLNLVGKTSMCQNTLRLLHTAP